MELFKIHQYYVVASSLEQAKLLVKDKLPASYSSEWVCPVDVVAVEQPLAPDARIPFHQMSFFQAISSRALWWSAYQYPNFFAWVYRRTKWEWARLSRYISFR